VVAVSSVKDAAVMQALELMKKKGGKWYPRGCDVWDQGCDEVIIEEFEVDAGPKPIDQEFMKEYGR